MSATTEHSDKRTEPGKKEKPVVVIKNLKKAFDGNEVLTGMNLELRPNENLAILGKSGSGKSVLIKCVVKLVDADDGDIKIFGKSIPDIDDDELNEVRKKTGFLFQSGALYDSMSVRENLEFPLRDLGNTDEENEKLVIAALKSVGLEEAIDKMPAELSGGMKKRLGLARSLMLKPELMLYDEPTTGLDPVTAKEISELIVEIQKKHNTSAIIITHDIECVRITANRIIVLKDGKCEAEGTFDELKDSDNDWVRSFFE